MNYKEKKAKRRASRMYGLKKMKKGEKHCWLASENKNGWALGFALNNGTLWLRNLRFASRIEVEKALKSAIVFIHLKDSTDLPKKLVKAMRKK